MRHYKSYPKKYLREIYNNLSIAMGTRHANKMINSCTLCGQCASVCPHGLNLGETVLEARRIMVEKGKMPSSAFEFALNDLAYSNSELAFLSRCAPGSKRSDYVFFPGCQLTAAAPGTVERTYRDLLERWNEKTGLLLGCCGVTADWAGETALFAKTKEQLTRALAAAGRTGGDPGLSPPVTTFFKENCPRFPAWVSGMFCCRRDCQKGMCLA